MPRDQTMELASRRTARPIDVLIVDDHPLFRDGLKRALEFEDDIRVVGQCKDGPEALTSARQYDPDVILLDVNLPEMNGLQVARQIRSENQRIKVIVLTAYHDSQQVMHAMRAGASAYCAKDVTPDDLVKTIRVVASGNYVVDDRVMSHEELQQWMSSSLASIPSHIVDGEEHFVPLSPRELEILDFVTNGMSNKEIASRLRISQQTVKNHMTSILKKLNVQDRTQAAVTALRHGWVRIRDNNGESKR
jgi:DNA-binding NarL/FixJ family response regulator